jgi:hypothetical protein
MRIPFGQLLTFSILFIAKIPSIAFANHANSDVDDEQDGIDPIADHNGAHGRILDHNGAHGRRLDHNGAHGRRLKVFPEDNRVPFNPYALQRGVGLLQYTVNGGRRDCTATLVDPKIILTAASCVFNDQNVNGNIIRRVPDEWHRSAKFHFGFHDNAPIFTSVPQRVFYRPSYANMVPGWQRDNYALIELRDAIGDVTGFMKIIGEIEGQVKHLCDAGYGAMGAAIFAQNNARIPYTHRIRLSYSLVSIHNGETEAYNLGAMSKPIAGLLKIARKEIDSAPKFTGPWPDIKDSRINCKAPSRPPHPVGHPVKPPSPVQRTNTPTSKAPTKYPTPQPIQGSDAPTPPVTKKPTTDNPTAKPAVPSSANPTHKPVSPPSCDGRRRLGSDGGCEPTPQPVVPSSAKPTVKPVVPPSDNPTSFPVSPPSCDDGRRRLTGDTKGCEPTPNPVVPSSANPTSFPLSSAPTNFPVSAPPTGFPVSPPTKFPVARPSCKDGRRVLTSGDCDDDSGSESDSDSDDEDNDNQGNHRRLRTEGESLYNKGVAYAVWLRMQA